MPNAIFVNFAAGETSPRSRGRFDLPWYRAACQKVLNFIPEISGPARYRTGFKFVRQTRGGAIARLVPFQINSTLNYILEFTPGKLRFYKNEDLLLKTPYDVLGATSLLDDFTDGDFTSSPPWAPFIAARVNVVANELVVDAFDGGGGVRGGAATTPQTRNIGTYQFDAEIENEGHVMFFATTYVPTTDADGVVSFLATGYGINRAGAGVNYQFGRYSGAGVFTNLLDLGVGGTGQKLFKIVRDSAGNWTITVDGILKGTVLDTTFTTCTLFAIQALTTNLTKTTIDNILRPGAGAGDNEGVITGITNADPAVATVAAVGDLADGDEVIISDVEGMFEMNGRQAKLANGSGLTFELVDPVTGANINSTAFGVYTSSGFAREVYEIDTPYFAADLDKLSWAISARDGVMYIAHPRHAPRKLTVDAADNFILATYTRTNDPFVKILADIQLTAVDKGTSTLVSFVAGSVINEDVVYTFSGIVGMTELNGGQFRIRISPGPTPRGFLVTEAGAEVDSTSFTDYVSGGIAAPAIESPIAVAFFESRLFFNGTNQRPNIILGSRAPDDNGNPRYDDFTGGTLADFAVFFALAPTSGQIDFTSWALGTARYLYVGTFGGPFRISGGGIDEPITPSSINVRHFDVFGCEATLPAGGARPFFIQRGGTALRTIRFNIELDDVESFDLTLNAEHIPFSPLKRVVLQTGRPDSLWLVREDGIMVGVTIHGTENVAGWHRQKVGGTNAKVLDIQVLQRTNENDQVWTVTERLINGVIRRFVEILTDDVQFPDIEDFFTDADSEDADDKRFRDAIYRRQEEYIHLDGAGTFNGSDRGTALKSTVTPAATTGASVAFTASISATFKLTDVGRQIWKKPDRDTGLGSGRAEILSVNGPGTIATCKILVDFDNTNAIEAGEWFLTATTIFGLAHWDGETVAVVTDGAVHSDGRTFPEFPQIIVANGKITLTDPAAVVHVGKPYEGFIQTHNFEAGGRSGPTQSKPRNIVEMFIRFLHTLGVDYGTDIYQLEKIPQRDIGQDIMDRPAPVFSGIKKLHHPDNTEKEEGKHVIVSQRLPLPCVVQFIDVRFDLTDEG